MSKDCILIMGSSSDKDNANKVLKIWHEVGVDPRVAIASCHKHGGGGFAEFINGIEEKLIVFLGGMSLAAPGLIEVINKKSTERSDAIVFGIPTDAAALSAIQDLPKGTAIITSGLNQVSLTHSLVNSALATAKLAMISGQNDNIFVGLNKWYKNNVEENPLVPDMELSTDGIIQ